MKNLLPYCGFGLLVVCGLCSHAAAQATAPVGVGRRAPAAAAPATPTPAQPNTTAAAPNAATPASGTAGGLNNLLGRAGFGGVGTKITVQTVDAIDSARGIGGRYRATVKTAVNDPNMQIPAGANAVINIVPATTGASPTFTLALATVDIAGQSVAVSGGAPVLGGTGMASGATNMIQSRLGGKLGGFLGNKPAANQPAQAATNVTPSVSGARVLVPAGSEIQFTMSQNLSAGNVMNRVRGVRGTQPVAGQQQLGVAPLAPGQQPVAGGQPQPLAFGQQQPAGAPLQNTAPAPLGASSTTVAYENIQYQLQGCQRQAPHIICQLQITNLGARDAAAVGGNASYYVDQQGDKVMASQRSIANCVGWGRCDLLPNVAMSGRFEFLDEDGRATQLVRLQINLSGKPVAQFTNVPVQ